jgi:hypothetical protein
LVVYTIQLKDTPAERTGGQIIHMLVLKNIARQVGNRGGQISQYPEVLKDIAADRERRAH